jgi:AraC-like DNA-binding protein
MLTGSGIGRVYIWDGVSLLIGKSVGMTNVHAHHAVQIALTPDGPIRFRTEEGDWAEYGGVAITPNFPHAFQSRDQSVAHVFVEPESREGRAILGRLGGTGIVGLENDDLNVVVPMLFDAWAARPGSAAMSDATRRVTRHFAGDASTASPVDERIARAVAYLKSHIDGPIALAEVASAVNLSPGRFRHLFVDETGMTLRAYILWLRFQRAWTLIGEGSSLSVAAHGAGFADAAHLTRTSQRMFGVPPVALEMESTV